MENSAPGDVQKLPGSPKFVDQLDKCQGGGGTNQRRSHAN